MNTNYRLSILAGVLLAFGAALVSCQKPLPEPTGNEETPGHEMTLVLKGGISRWDALATKGAAEDGWQDGNTLYIQLDNGSKTIPLKAYYRSDSDSWAMNFDAGALDGVTSGAAKCYYFEDYSSGDRGKLSLNIGTRIYQDEAATYELNPEGDCIVLNIQFAPKTGRIRFTPEYAGDGFTGGFHGLSFYRYFDANTFTFTAQEGTYDDWPDYQIVHFNITDSENYFYGFFTDPTNPSLIVFQDYSQYYYERTFDADVLAPGHSSVCRFPASDSHNEWWMYNDRILDSYQLQYYRFVPAGTFRMGGEGYGPVHTVTISRPYYLSEREITRAQWYWVMGGPSGYNTDNPSMPVTGKTWDEIQTFIATLNATSGNLRFRLPTEAEWEWAARGGIRQMGYLYSGNNNEGNLWHNTDALRASSYVSNEMMLCDMSGNAAEFCADWYGPYPEYAVTDPIGPDSGSYHVIRGGDITSPEEAFRVYARNSDETSSLEYTGFRLLMEVPRP